MAQASAGPISGSKLDNRRVIAGLIDLAIVAVGAAVILAAAGVLGDSPSELGAPLIGVTLGWTLYYYFASESGAGQTVGKRIMRLRVVRADGAPADMREIALRTVLRVIDMQFLYLVGLIVMIATGERRARLGDLVGKTKIVSADKTAPIAAPATPAVPVSRVPIAESGPAFAPAVEAEAEPEVELESPSLQELAADVAATAGSAPDEPEPEAEEEPAEELAAEGPEAEEAPEPRGEEPDDDVLAEPVAEEPAEEAVAEELAEEPADAPAEEPADEDEDEEKVTVKSVETVSAIDLVMDESAKDS